MVLTKKQKKEEVKEQPKQSVDTSNKTLNPNERKPAYHGEVVTKEFFSPSAKRNVGFQPHPEQIIGTSSQLTTEKQAAIEQLNAPIPELPLVETPEEKIKRIAEAPIPPFEERLKGILPSGETQTATLAAGTTGLGAAVTGAIGGFTVGGPVGALIGGAGGLITGTIAGFVTKLTLAKRTTVKDATNDFVNAKGNLNKILYYLNHGGSPTEAITEWNYNLKLIRNAQKTLDEMNSTELESFLSGGKDDAADIVAFWEGYDYYYKFQFENALRAPNINYVDYSINPSNEK